MNPHETFASLIVTPMTPIVMFESANDTLDNSPSTAGCSRTASLAVITDFMYTNTDRNCWTKQTIDIASDVATQAEPTSITSPFFQFVERRGSCPASPTDSWMLRSLLAWEGRAPTRDASNSTWGGRRIRTRDEDGRRQTTADVETVSGSVICRLPTDQRSEVKTRVNRLGKLPKMAYGQDSYSGSVMGSVLLPSQKHSITTSHDDTAALATINAQRSRHSSRSRYLCVVVGCKKSFSRRDNRRMHYRKHLAPGERARCQACDIESLCSQIHDGDECQSTARREIASLRKWWESKTRAGMQSHELDVELAVYHPAQDLP